MQFNAQVSPAVVMSNEILFPHFDSLFFFINKDLTACFLSFIRLAAGKSNSEEHSEETGKFITQIKSAIKS